MVVTGTYNPYLVALSILVACVASYTALDLSAEDRRRLNGGVEQILSKSAYVPSELVKRVAALLAEVKRKTS